jgi:hypothetical protein
MEPTHSQRRALVLAQQRSSERRAAFLRQRTAAANQSPDRRRQVSAGERIVPRVHRDNGI